MASIDKNSAKYTKQKQREKERQKKERQRQREKEKRIEKSLRDKQRRDAKRQAERLVKAQIKEMRRYSKELRKIDLRKKLDRKTISKTKKTWKDYQTYTTRGFVVFRSNNSDRQKRAKKYSQQKKSKGSFDFDVAFLPTTLSKPRVKFEKNGEIKITQGNLTEIPVQFNMRAMAANPAQEIDRILREYPEANAFLLMCGAHTFNGLLTRETLARKVADLMSQYSPGGSGYKPAKRGGNNHWQNWLFGTYIINMGSNKANLQWLKEHRQRNEEQKKAKQKQRAAFRRKYGSKS